MSGSLTLAEANSILGAAVTKARELNILVSVTVCDNQGRLIAFNRMDGALLESDRFSIGKAVASAGTGLPSGQIEGIFYHPLLAVEEGTPVFRIPGGLPIFRDGQVAGGCGVDGALSHEQEEECARAGIASIPS
jgi:glc operon protein GlcG